MGTAGESKPSPPVIAVSEPPNASAAADEAVAELTAEEPKPAPQRQIAAAPLAVGATLATALPGAPPEPFAFSSDPLGKLEAERLPPPRRVPLENFPWVKEPQSTALRFPDVVLARLWSFPTALPGGESRSLPIEHPAIARTLPTLDRPTLPAFTPELAPQQPEFVIALRTRVASPRQDEVPAPPATLQPFEPKAVAQDDPGHATAWRLLLTPLAFLDPIAAAPERGGIPDPYDHLRAVRWQSPPAEAMAPSVSYARPAPLTLPVEK